MRTHGGVTGMAPSGAMFGKFTRAKFARTFFAALCLFLGLLGQAQAAKYVYDGGGRLVAVTRDDGTSARYIYDAMGNLLEVRTEPAGTLRLFAFAPTHGTPGTPVTVYGQGFDGAALSVSFNGVTGSVLSSTANELHTTVPDGATTGPITITAGGQSVVSDALFFVDDTGLAPEITGIAPTVAAVGDTVTVSGSHLHPGTGTNTVSVGHVAVSPASATNTQIQFTVPSSVGSGKVEVTTSYGQAVSAQDLVVVPASVGTANVVASARATVDGTGVNMSVAADKFGALLFDAPLGSWLSVQLDQLVLVNNGLTYTVYDPAGRVATQGSLDPLVATIHLPQITLAGTYTVLLKPSNASAQFQARVETSPRMSVDGSDLSVSTGGAGESKRIVFTARSGDNLGLALTNVAVTGSSPYNDWVRFQVYDSANRLIANVGSGGGNNTHLWGVSGGTFLLIITPGGGPSGLLQIQNATATLTRDIVGPQLIYGATTTVNLPRPGQTERLTFTANAGDTVTFAANAVTTTPANNIVYYTIYRPDGGQLTTLSTSSPTAWNLENLPDSGTYMVVTNASWGLPNTSQLTLLHGVTDTMTVDGPSKSYAAAVAGQNIYITFNANAGDNLELALSGVSVGGGSPYNDWVTAGVYDPNGRLIANFGSNAGNNAHLWGLAAGTYRIVIAPGGGSNGLLQIQSATVTLTRDITGQLPYGTATAVNLPRPGQAARLTFTANAGDTVALAANAVTTTPAGYNVYFLVYRPDGTQLTFVNTTSAATWNLANLPQSGTYTVVTWGSWGLPNSSQLTLLSGVVDTLAVDGPSKSYATGAIGQNIYLTFDANAGDNLELALTGVSVSGGSPSNDWASVGVYDPNGRYIANFGTGAGNNVHLWGLAAGTYSIVITPGASSSGSLQIQNATVTLTRDITGLQLLNGTATTVDLPRPGQAARLTFSGSAGDAPTLTVNAISTTPAGYSVYFTIYRPDGTQLTSFSAVNPTALSLPTLPQGGTYTVLVTVIYGLPANVQLTLSGATGS